MVKKIGTEPQYIFADPHSVSEILNEQGIFAEHPHYDFYKKYILDNLKGTFFISPEEMKSSILNLVHKTASLNFKKKAIRFPKPQVTKEELKRLYIQEAKRIYDEELMDEIITKFIDTLEKMIALGEKEYEMSADIEYQIQELKGMVWTLEEAEIPEQKMIAIDRAINIAHQSGVYGEFLVKDADSSFFEELGNLKISSLNLRRKAEYRTDQENFYEPGISDEWPKGPKKTKTTSSIL